MSVSIPFVLSLLSSAQGPVPKPLDLSKVLSRVTAKGLERSVRDLVSFGTRHTFSSTKDPKRGTGAARDYIENRLREAAKRSSGRMKVERKTYQLSVLHKGNKVSVVNLVATIEGQVEPERVFLISGHYDSRNTHRRDGQGDAPGANDDGSGSAAVLEMADALAEEPLRCSVRLVLFDGEEHGLWGSREEARDLAEKGIHVEGMMTLDIVGNTEGPDGRRERSYVRVFSYLNTVKGKARGGLDSPGRRLARLVARAADQHVPDFRVKLIFRGDRYGRGGDHRPFAQLGIPAIRMTEPLENFGRQHQDLHAKDGKPYGDLPEFMDFPYLEKVSRTALSAILEQAKSPKPPRRMLARVQRDLSTSVFLLPPESAEGLFGYEVVWRPTTQARWTRVRFFPAEGAGSPSSTRGFLRIELKDVMLDDNIVGIRSVGANGARSIAISAPERDL
jgi:hypothetical protein